MFRLFLAGKGVVFPLDNLSPGLNNQVIKVY